MLDQSADANEFVVVVFAICGHINIRPIGPIGPISLPSPDQIKHTEPSRPPSHHTAESHLLCIAASGIDSAVRSGSPAAERSAWAPCLRSFAIVQLWRHLSRSAWAQIARALRYKDALAARTIHQQAILRQSFPCTSRPRARQLPRLRPGHA